MSAPPPAWAALDPRHLWHPYARARGDAPAAPVVGGEGARLRLADGRELIDGMASWWCAVHGYRPPRLIAALHAQIDALPHVMFGGLTHEPAARLAARLAELAGGGLDRVFFCDSGSVAVEVALKIALQRAQADGRPERGRFLALRGGYHGDTFAAMSVSDPDNSLHARFRALLPRQRFTPRPPAIGCGRRELREACARFDADLDAHRAELAGAILEPVLQGAGGFHVYEPAFLAHAAAACAARGVPLIADEIATGFGRTGALFACRHADVAPDLMCVGKALTGGVLSLAAVLARGELAAAADRAGPLPHGPTFMANPAACRVALASLELLQERDWRADIRRIEAGLRRALEPLAAHPDVAAVRALGAFAVVEAKAPVSAADWQAHAALRGVWLRPFSRYVYTMPPYIVSDAELRQVTDAIRSGVEAGLAGGAPAAAPSRI